MSRQQLEAKGFDLQNAENARHAWERVSQFWYKIGGDTKKLRQSIIEGSKRKAQKLSRQHLAQMKAKGADGEFSNFDPVSDAAIGTYISLGIPLVTAMINFASKSNANKNPYAVGKTPAGFTTVPDPTDLPIYDPITKRIIDPVTREEMGVKDTILGIPTNYFIYGSVTIGVIALIVTVMAIRKNQTI